MMYVTGDTHSDFSRFKMKNFPEQKEMDKNDYVVICGDFGGLWSGSKEENFWLDWLDGRPFTTLFVSGNHENYDMLDVLPAEDMFGGRVQRVRKSVMHLMRGQVYEIAGKRIYSMGGASSHDMEDGILDPSAPGYMWTKRRLDMQGGHYRVRGKSWWERELPCDSEYQNSEKNLDLCKRRVDYIFTHCCPTHISDIIGGGEYKSDRLTDYFDAISQNCDFRYWFFCHYHDNRVIDQRYVLLYEQIVRIV